ncbi:MAG TPA: hypothetical protein DCL80_10370 [Balneola sp.]|jgi:putative effector of murein hydrolase LrgA (UPF0299 family)|nr:hypothetical protein [Bacteroidota bacterium]MAC06583.1 hypothetical protein [Balneola sp.]MAO79027.1 hypothetical protein [Balneola sp.]MBF63686.1 hypothetical protein [Balneola sp.]HAH51634.1 hypothetical protein [Balneola sp.]|tara:strand:- start:11142 stop:11417 length:276 start_codon:yes stop_codon:yes gene_type:complete
MNIVSLSVGLAGLMIVGGVLAMIISGIRSLTQGKQDFKRIALMLVPVVVFAITYFSLGQDEVKAAVMTAGVMMGGMVLTIFLTGLRGTFKF